MPLTEMTFDGLMLLMYQSSISGRAPATDGTVGNYTEVNSGQKNSGTNLWDELPHLGYTSARSPTIKRLYESIRQEQPAEKATKAAQRICLIIQGENRILVTYLAKPG